MLPLHSAAGASTVLKPNLTQRHRDRNTKVARIGAPPGGCLA